MFRRMFIFLFLGFTFFTLSACKSGPPPAEFTFEMSEFAFTPNTFEVQVGQEVTFHLVNKGALTHEFMVGRNAMMVDGQPSGYEHNMFEGEEPMVMGASDDHSMSTMGADHGFMVAVPTNNDEITVTFTVTEDMVGEWEIGCFLDGGSHYNQGMTGTLKVNP